MQGSVGARKRRRSAREPAGESDPGTPEEFLRAMSDAESRSGPGTPIELLRGEVDVVPARTPRRKRRRAGVGVLS